jgi:hypothetical protein
MPPLLPPPECAPHLETREDDKEHVIRKRLQVCCVWGGGGGGLLHNSVHDPQNVLNDQCVHRVSACTYGNAQSITTPYPRSNPFCLLAWFYSTAVHVIRGMSWSVITHAGSLLTA